MCSTTAGSTRRPRYGSQHGAARSPPKMIRSATPLWNRCAPFSTSRSIFDADNTEYHTMNDLGLAGLDTTILFDQIIPARAPWDRVVHAGETLRIIDLEGNQAVDFLLYALRDDTERYSAQDTIAAQRNIFLRTGSEIGRA